MFDYLKEVVGSFAGSLSKKIASILDKKELDKEFLNQLEMTLLASDFGMKTTKRIIDELIKRNINDPLDVKDSLKEILSNILNKTVEKTVEKKAYIYLIVGVNGSGKTSFSGKFAAYQKSQGNKVLLVAADTFRAAAVDQLYYWSKEIGIDICKGESDTSPSTVVFNACKQFQANHYDLMIIDTAGRLQTKTYLMQELAKLKKVIKKQMPEYEIATLLVLDGLIGNNAFAQTQIFKEATDVDGIVLTKMDDPSRGGVIFAIAIQFDIPVKYISFGEKLYQMTPFNVSDYIDGILKRI
ncbi:signal recognition particle-docking protein FtsY [bacterium]|nr:MAG: signal recognition particle-docking protein FtsY [bacterium]QQR62250.1 MAG: signal recognition particle-docking protein FtsY [bacterium]QQR63186.1 MAG: signal recognition particle-docking protein FtsY [bacterium]